MYTSYGQQIHRKVCLVDSTHFPSLPQADYRQDGHEELICCSVEGEVRGYLPSGFVSGGHASLSDEPKALEELSLKKQVLTRQI